MSDLKEALAKIEALQAEVGGLSKRVFLLEAAQKVVTEQSDYFVRQLSAADNKADAAVASAERSAKHAERAATVADATFTELQKLKAKK